MAEKLSERALENLRSIRQTDRTQGAIERAVSEAIPPFRAKTYRRTVLVGDDSGTQLALQADVSRSSFIVVCHGSTGYLDLESPVAALTGVRVSNNGDPIYFKWDDWGMMIRVAWYAKVDGTSKLYIYESLK